MITLFIYEYIEGCGYGVGFDDDNSGVVWASRYPFNLAETKKFTDRFYAENPSGMISLTNSYGQTYVLETWRNTWDDVIAHLTYPPIGQIALMTIPHPEHATRKAAR